MKRLLQITADVATVVASAILAIWLRENFDVTSARLLSHWPYFLSAVLASALVLPILGLHRSIWRFSRLHDYLRIFLALALTVILATALTFAYDRLTSVSRSLPVLHFIVGACLMIGLRVGARMRHLRRQMHRAEVKPMSGAGNSAVRSVLLVGVSDLTEAYIEAVNQLSPGKVNFVGILGRSDRQVGRLAGRLKVLGRPEDVEQIVDEIEVHGVTVDCIVVLSPLASLSSDAREAILRLHDEADIELRLVEEDLGFGEPRKRPGGAASTAISDDGSVSFRIAEEHIAQLNSRPYWRIKRSIDVVVASAMLIMLAPLLLAVAIGVAVSIGQPILFWQQRPGFCGRPFRLYKFRTMAPARNSAGQALSDDERVSRFGNTLRRYRLDELPQLYNILIGDMSLVGPRPLLPRDQFDSARERLLVRPGLTGWAQVIGGRVISAEDKAALDIQYVRDCSLRLDFEIICRTVPMVLYGETTDYTRIRAAWRSLAGDGIVSTNTACRMEHRLRTTEV